MDVMNFVPIESPLNCLFEGMGENLLTVFRKKAGLSQNKLAKLAGKPRQFIHRLETGETKMAQHHAELLSPHLNVTASELMFGDTPNQAPTIRYVKKLGKVQAGVWMEQDALECQAEPDTYPVPVDPRWPEDAVYILELKGSSINKLGADGSHILCLDYAAAPADSLQDGDPVVIERHKDGIFEVTAKIARKGAKGWEFWPHSDDPKYQEPVIALSKGVERVIIKAYILEFLKAGKRF
jgi:transcriptional regulator with XRE-family HTH domain